MVNFWVFLLLINVAFISAMRHHQVVDEETEDSTLEEWRVYDHNSQHELCQVLQCQATEVCLVRSNNAFCVDRKKVAGDMKKSLQGNDQPKTIKFARVDENGAEEEIELQRDNSGKWQRRADKLWQQSKAKGGRKVDDKYVHKVDTTEQPAAERHQHEKEVEEAEAEKNCDIAELAAIGPRVLKWFGDIHAAESHETVVKSPRHKIVCLAEVSWMFGQLDGDANGRLTPEELWTLEHDRYEPCLRPLIDRCDSDADQDISMDEWCDCFQYANRAREEPPCHKQKHQVDPHLTNVFSPHCDTDGYFRPAQCHQQVCWCVDRWGREFPNSRVEASKPDCGQYADEEL